MDNNTPANDLSGNQKGISNSTIAVLVILALVMTIIGTLAVINTNNNIGPTSSYSNNLGKVSFQILSSQPIAHGTESIPNETK